MNKIKFSHNYPKLWNQTEAKLCAVLPMMINKDTPKDLLEYDTKIKDGEYYELKHGSYIQLVFVGNKGIPFCTIRNHNPGKAGYYISKVGQDFVLDISES